MAKKSTRNRYKQRLAQSLNLLATVLEYNTDMSQVYESEHPEISEALEATNLLILEAGNVLNVIHNSL